ncbi:caspase domain-containing protein [Suillus lakei]|nr:caspase domain-containing protein [Suillus lakei]
MSPKITEIDANPFPAAFDLVRRDHHTCKRRWTYASWELSKIQQTGILVEETTIQGRHKSAESSRCPRSSRAPYLKQCRMPEASHIPIYTQPSLPSPGRKRALLIGINYKGQRCELRGCNNDIRNILPCLIDQWGYHPTDIVQLIDDGRGPLPTKRNILLEMQRLAYYARAGDSMFFYFSGHGGQIRDQDGDEVDGYDEFICPFDYQHSGVIDDDEIHEIMVKPLVAGSRLTALFDSCHSGTVLDLPYLYDSGQCKFVDGVTPGARVRKHSQAQVVSISFCELCFSVNIEQVCFSGCGDSEESESVTMPGQPIGGLMTFVGKPTMVSVPSNLPLKAFIHVFCPCRTLVTGPTS